MNFLFKKFIDCFNIRQLDVVVLNVLMLEQAIGLWSVENEIKDTYEFCGIFKLILVQVWIKFVT